MASFRALSFLKKAVIPNSRKKRVAFPATIAATLVLMFLLFSMSPAMDGVMIKSAAAYDISIDDDNYVSHVWLYGRPRADSSSDVAIAMFTTTDTGGVTYYANDGLRVDGYIKNVEILINSESPYLQSYFSSLGYGSVNMTLFKQITKLTVSITNPSSVVTNIAAYDYIVSQYPTSNATLVDDEVGFTCDIPDYVFSAAGTYTIAYTYEVYY